jgi:hypothetical protein
MESSIFYAELPTFALRDEGRGDLKPLAKATWADWDHRGRLVYAAEGRLFAAEMTEQGASEPVQLADFNANRPEHVESPDWARRWQGRAR